MDSITSFSEESIVYFFQLILSVSFILIAIHYSTLTVSGAVSAVFLGNIVIYCSGFTALIPLLLFFTGSHLISRFGFGEKVASDARSEKPRNATQVFSNAGIYLACSILEYVTGKTLYQTAMMISIATSTADTWSSEVGCRVKGTTFLFPSFRKCAPGISGGISSAGTLAGLTGAVFIGASGFLITKDVHSITTIATAGMCGMFLDSLIGNYFQIKFLDASSWKWLDYSANYRATKGFQLITNDAVNIFSNLCTTGFYLMVA